MKNLMLVFVAIAFLLSGCLAPMAIKDVQSDSYVGKQVTVSGIVQGSIKIGDLSGYLIKDDTSSIGVYSLNLPKEGDKKTVTGTLRKIPFLGYYIEE